MANAKAKTIKLLLNDGTLEGVMSMADSGWNSGKLYSAPRDSVDDLLTTDACKKYGVYLLLSEKKVYVGQASDLAKRISQHKVGKDWWERAVILTTSDDSFNRSDIDYLESFLIALAVKNNTLDCDNKNKGNTPKVDDFRRVELQNYLEEALFLMALIGINVFEKNARKKNTGEKTKAVIDTIPINSENKIELRAKRTAIEFLKQNGISLGKNVNYASRQENRNEFWINPRTDMLEKDWFLILNNQFDKELIVLNIPANTYEMNKVDKNGFFARHDKPYYIDMNITADQLIDRRSKIDLSKHETSRIKY